MLGAFFYVAFCVIDERCKLTARYLRPRRDKVMAEKSCKEPTCERVTNHESGFCSQHRKTEKEPDGIQEVLRNESTGLQSKIVRFLGDSTVALLAISNYPEQLELAGTGTLVSIDGVQFILTAAHVWEKVLKNSDHIGIALKPDWRHRFGIKRSDIAVFSLPKPEEWNEWGPDLALLLIPADRVGSIAACKTFWNLTMPDRKIDRKVLAVDVLMGTPAALGNITGASADLQISGMFLGPEKVCDKNGLDYLDYQMELVLPPDHSFGGVSGGGVWIVYLYYSSETNNIDWTICLHGVAFYELEIVNGRRPIRCHGPESIRAVIRTVSNA
jgi:hypothetical protein